LISNGETVQFKRCISATKSTISQFIVRCNFAICPPFKSRVFSNQANQVGRFQISTTSSIIKCKLPLKCWGSVCYEHILRLWAHLGPDKAQRIRQHTGLQLKHSNLPRAWSARLD